MQIIWMLLLSLLVGTCSQTSGSYVEPIGLMKRERVHLPTICRPLFDNDTDEWIECMGVGYK